MSKEELEKLCHDLKTPISVIKISSDLFKMTTEYKEGGKEQRKFVKTVEEQIKKLLNKISDSK